MPFKFTGNNYVIGEEYIANMLRALAPRTVDVTTVNLRANARHAILFAATEETKYGCTLISSESVFNRIFNWALDERTRLFE